MTEVTQQENIEKKFIQAGNSSIENEGDKGIHDGSNSVQKTMRT